jgi:hypothetical protein
MTFFAWGVRRARYTRRGRVCLRLPTNQGDAYFRAGAWTPSRP